LTVPLVIECEGEHAPQVIHAVSTLFFIKVDYDFGVSLCFEVVTATLKLGAEIEKVVDLTIENHPDGSVFVKDWLLTARQINNAEAAHSEGDITLDKDAFGIRTTVNDGFTHAVNESRVDLFTTIGIDHSGNSTHSK
jgi:alpha-L-fucosidase